MILRDFKYNSIAVKLYGVASTYFRAIPGPNNQSQTLTLTLLYHPRVWHAQL